jgi:hypothetical protein
MRGLVLLGIGILIALASASAAPKGHSFDDPLFRRCIDWMMNGSGGALIDNLCLDEFALPPPSLFICARKVRTGFTSEADREGCAILFDEEARKVRAGYVR